MKENQSVIDEWNSIKAPAPPELKEITVEAKTTAFLVLDVQNQNCNSERRPRCVSSIPKIKKLLTEARKKEMTVVYSLTRAANEKDIRKEVEPLENEPIVKSGVDKFHQTDLEKILTAKDIKQVIIVGTAAHGAVLHTATGAAQRQMEVVIPVDGLSAGEPYAEQYTVWHLVNAPGTRRSVTLTKINWIKIV
ncbi:MAG: cysteine hydrolase [Candidatus Hermodarchaeota archaeon]